MKRKQLRLTNGFRVAFGNKRGQAAGMVLPPQDAEGSPDNRHRGADQWLYVVSGTGTALLNGKRMKIKEGTLMLIERKDHQEIKKKNTGRAPLRTLNIYVPPAYTKGGDPLPRGRK